MRPPSFLRSPLSRTIVGFFGLVGLLYLIADFSASRAVRRAQQLFRDAGRPMRLEDVLPLPVPESEDRAIYLARAIGELKGISYERNDLFTGLHELSQLVTSDDPSGGDFEELDRLRRGETFEAAHEYFLEAARKPFYDAQLRERIRGATGRIRLFEVAMLFEIYEGIIAVDQHFGREHEGLRNLIVLTQLANSLADQPFFTIQKSRSACFDAVFHALKSYRFSTTPPNELHDALLPFADPEPIVRSIDGERLYYGSWLFEGNPNGVPHTIEFDEGDPRRWIAWLPLVKKRDHALFLKRFHSIHSTLGSSRPQIVARENRPNFYSTPPVAAHVDGPQVQQLLLRTLAQARVALSGIQLIQRRFHDGAFPGTLPKFVNEQSMDPFTHVPLLYKRTPLGFRLGSAGPTVRGDNETHSDRIDWTYPPPSAALPPLHSPYPEPQGHLGVNL